MTEPISTSTLMAHGALAIFGGVVHALSAHRQWKSKTLLDFFMLTIMSSFTWIIFWLIALHLSASIYIALAMTWTWWFLWVEWMWIVVEYFKNKFK